MSDPTPNRPAEAQRLVEAGVAASQSGDGDRAVSLFVQACAAAPGWPVPHFLLASESAACGQWEQAEAQFAAALLVDPGFSLARYQLGLLQFSTGRAALALLTWQPLLDSREQALAAFVRGFTALAQDDFAGARTEFESGLAAPDVNPAVAGDIRQVLGRIAQAAAEQPVPPTSSVGASHVLVANYGKFDLH